MTFFSSPVGRWVGSQVDCLRSAANDACCGARFGAQGSQEFSLHSLGVRSSFGFRILVSLDVRSQKAGWGCNHLAMEEHPRPAYV